MGRRFLDNNSGTHYSLTLTKITTIEVYCAVFMIQDPCSEGHQEGSDSQQEELIVGRRGLIDNC